MFYVIKKFQFSSNSIVFGLLVVIKRTQCQLSVSMVTEKGLIEIATSIIEIKNGANLSLICRIVNKENEKLHNLVVWTKHVKKRKFSIVNSDNESLGANLSFTSVGLQHQGAYSCIISPKYKVAKFVYVLIRLDPLRIDRFKLKHFSPRRKRSDNDDGYSFTHLDNPSVELLQKAIESIRRDPPYQPDRSTRNDNSNRFNNFYRRYNDDSEEIFTPGLIIILVLMGGWAVLVLWALAHNCCKKAKCCKKPETIDLPPTYVDSAENFGASSMHSLNEIAAGPPTNSNNGDCNTLPPSYEEACNSTTDCNVENAPGSRAAGDPCNN